jgi:hypothetical protein
MNSLTSKMTKLYPWVTEGDGYSIIITGGKKLGKFAIVMIAPKANESILRHEMGHIMFDLRKGKRGIKAAKFDTTGLKKAMSYLSRTYSKKSEHGIEYEERRAWDLAGVPKDDGLRKAALETHETGMGASTAAIRWAIYSALSFPFLRSWAKSLFGMAKKKEESIQEGKKSKPKSKYERLKANRAPLTPEERALVMKRKAIWHHGPNGAPSPAVWKSVSRRTGKVTYVTNTHRAYNTRPTVRGAIDRYHKFIKGTA